MALIPNLTGIYSKIGGLPLNFGDPRFKLCAYQTLAGDTAMIYPALRVEEPNDRDRSRLAHGENRVELFGNELWLYGVPGTLAPAGICDCTLLINASYTGDRWLADIWADPLVFYWRGPVAYDLLVRPREYR